jgi:hypothetical protein
MTVSSTTHIDWGTIPTWLSAVATSAGILWALMLFRVNRRDAIRSLASSVFCRIDREDEETRLEISNDSAKPISSVTAYVLPSESPVGERGWIRSDDTYQFDLKDEKFKDISDSCFIEFDDADGRRWKKTSDGVLNIIRKKPAKS